MHKLQKLLKNELTRQAVPRNLVLQIAFRSSGLIVVMPLGEMNVVLGKKHNCEKLSCLRLDETQIATQGTLCPRNLVGNCAKGQFSHRAPRVITQLKIVAFFN